MRFPLRVATYQTLIGLLAASGLRIGEAIGSYLDPDAFAAALDEARQEAADPEQG